MLSFSMGFLKYRKADPALLADGERVPRLLQKETKVTKKNEGLGAAIRANIVSFV
jgi:hypothetical protein